MALDLTEAELNEALTLSPSSRYSDPKSPVLKKDGSVRKIKNPCGLIRKVQSKINRRINRSCILWPSYLFGSIPRNEKTGVRDYVSCAAVHCQSKSILKIDISSFFDRIHYDHVKCIFSGLFRYADDVAAIVANLCCYDKHLVQGALTSSYIANLVFWDVEHKVVKRLRRMGLKYTRLIDDITISSKAKDFDFSLAESIVGDMLKSKDLPTNNQKRQLSYSGITPLKVHGLQVNHSSPIFPKEEVKRIIAAVHEIQVRANKLHQTKEKNYRNLYNRTLGRVNKLARVKNDRRERMINILMSDGLRPKPSDHDLHFCEKRYAWLLKNYNKSKDKYIYHHRYYYLKNLLHFMIKFGSGKYDLFSSSKLNLIQSIRPTYVNFSR